LASFPRLLSVRGSPNFIAPKSGGGPLRFPFQCVFREIGVKWLIRLFSLLPSVFPGSPPWTSGFPPLLTGAPLHPSKSHLQVFSLPASFGSPEGTHFPKERPLSTPSPHPPHPTTISPFPTPTRCFLNVSSPICVVIYKVPLLLFFFGSFLLFLPFFQISVLHGRRLLLHITPFFFSRLLDLLVTHFLLHHCLTHVRIRLHEPTQLQAPGSLSTPPDFIIDPSFFQHPPTSVGELRPSVSFFFVSF